MKLKNQDSCYKISTLIKHCPFEFISEQLKLNKDEYRLDSTFLSVFTNHMKSLYNKLNEF